MNKRNDKRTEAVQALRRSGAAGTHADRRTKRKRTRGTKLAQALKDYE